MMAHRRFTEIGRGLENDSKPAADDIAISGHQNLERRKHCGSRGGVVVNRAGVAVIHVLMLGECSRGKKRGGNRTSRYSSGMALEICSHGVSFPFIFFFAKFG